jgi:hypothetical protein
VGKPGIDLSKATTHDVKFCYCTKCDEIVKYRAGYYKGIQLHYLERHATKKEKDETAATASKGKTTKARAVSVKAEDSKASAKGLTTRRGRNKIGPAASDKAKALATVRKELATETKTRQALEKRLNDLEKNQEKIKKDLETDKQTKVAEEADDSKPCAKDQKDLETDKQKAQATEEKTKATEEANSPKPAPMTPRNVIPNNDLLNNALHLHRNLPHWNLLRATLGQAAGLVPDAVDESTNASNTADSIVAVLDSSLVNAANPIVAPGPLNVTLPHKGNMVIESIHHKDTKTAIATTIVLLRVLLRVDTIVATVTIITDIMDITVEAIIMVTTGGLSDITIGHSKWYNDYC